MSNKYHIKKLIEVEKNAIFVHSMQLLSQILLWTSSILKSLPLFLSMVKYTCTSVWHMVEFNYIGNKISFLQTL